MNFDKATKKRKNYRLIHNRVLWWAVGISVLWIASIVISGKMPGILVLGLPILGIIASVFLLARIRNLSEGRIEKILALVLGVMLTIGVIVLHVGNLLNTQQSDYGVSVLLSYIWGLTIIEGALLFIIIHLSIIKKWKIFLAILAILCIEVFNWFFLIAQELTYVPLLLFGAVCFFILEAILMFSMSFRRKESTRRIAFLISIFLILLLVFFGD